MAEIEQYPVLDYIVSVLKKAIADAKVEKQAENIAIVKDGNDVIRLEQLADSSANAITIDITDKKDIILSEDLLDTLLNIEDEVKGDAALKTALAQTTIVINGLTVETGLIFQAVKECFDELSDSYELVKILEKEINRLKIQFKFGAHTFNLNLTNTEDEVHTTAEFPKALDAGVTKAIEGDTLKVQNAVNKLFKF